MKQRIITAIILLTIVFIVFYAKIELSNSYPLYFIGIFLVITAMSEMIAMKETEKAIPVEIHIFSYLAVISMSFYKILKPEFNLPDVKIDSIPFVLIILGVTMVVRKNFKFVDASFMLFAIYYVGLSFFTLAEFLERNILELVYIILIAVVTDTAAYFVGSAIGKHKLAPSISPKKTIEGSVGGSLAATIAVSIYAYFTVMQDKTLVYIIVMTFLLTIMSQFGDLIASVMKRYFKIKDYGNLFPGHGGVLDRLDSILFTSLTYYYFIQFYEIIIKYIWW